MFSFKNISGQFLSALLTLVFTILFSFSSLISGTKQELPQTPEAFTPVLRFAVCSDVHLDGTNDKNLLSVTYYRSAARRQNMAVEHTMMTDGERLTEQQNLRLCSGTHIAMPKAVNTRSLTQSLSQAILPTEDSLRNICSLTKSSAQISRTKLSF